MKGEALIGLSWELG